MPPTLEVFLRFARLGLTAFGGPIAHLGYFRREFVERAAWLSDAEYAELVALCTALPGPTSSQVGMLLGARRAGPLGAVLAWLAFTTPSAVAMGCFGFLMIYLADPSLIGWRHGNPPFPATAVAALRLYASHGHWQYVAPAFIAMFYVALAVVLVAIAGMVRANVTTAFARRVAIGSFAAALALGATRAGLGVLVLPVAAWAGARFGPRTSVSLAPLPFAVSRPMGFVALGLLSILVIATFFVAPDDGITGLAATCFRAGSLVFGGGHVVLAFLSALVGMPDGRHAFVTASTFDIGYGAAQAVPGPLFTFAAFIGGTEHGVSNEIAAPLAILAIFAPSALLLPAALALWADLRAIPAAGAALAAINASVTGLLAATFVNPMLAAAFTAGAERWYWAVAPLAFVLLVRAKWPAWLVLATCALVAVLANAIVLAMRVDPTV